MNMPSRMEVRKISELIPYENNARTHPPEQLEKLRRSLEAFGFVSPVLIDGRGRVIAGHGRIEAAKLAGIDEAPCVLVEHLSDEQRRAYILADNRLAELGAWDEALVAGELQALQAAGADLTLTGFDEAEIELPGEAPEISEDDFDPEPPEEPVSRRGQIWQLGRHRLMCGDATSADDMTALMAGDRADICFTSPPYNLGLSMSKGIERMPNPAMHCGHAYVSYSDNLTDEEYTRLLTSSLRNSLSVCDDVMFNLGLLSHSRIGVLSTLYAFSDFFGDVIVWNKSMSMPLGLPSQRGLLSHRCELIFCFNNRGIKSFSHPQWESEGLINRIDTCNNCRNPYAAIHAAGFPVELPAEIIKNFTETSVLDPFGGSGTTMIAAEQTGRRCYMMEIDPHYCDVIIRRWEEFTGEKAVLLNG